MMIKLFLLSLVFFALSGVFSTVFGKNDRRASLIGAWGCVLSCVMGIIPAFSVFLSGHTLTFRTAWAVPYGSFSLAIDPLSGFFLAPIFFLSALAAIYGSRYLEKWYGKKSVGIHWLFFNLLVASMALVVTAKNAILFLFVWEVMSVSSFFLVTFEDEKEKARSAGNIYLVATHIGTAFLFIMFMLLGKEWGSMDFGPFLPRSEGYGASLIFLLAVVGFGTKAGLVPFHVWLPEAHPAAPSHVSAVMSGVMIKTGIYGIVRIVSILGMPPLWWGWALIAVGAVSGVIGVLFAMAQQDIKKLLAYSSVENIGVITLGLGVGLIGSSAGIPALAFLGYAGALLHVLNHSVFKGLLFLAAGSVVRSSGTHHIDALGGVMKRMRLTGLGFLVGAAAISALPPLNGFMSEFLIYFGAFHGVSSIVAAGPCLVVMAALALIGALVLACFAKVFGAVFLGEARSDAAAQTRETPPEMWAPVLVLAFLCAAIGLGAPFILKGMWNVVISVAVIPYTYGLERAAEARTALFNISLFSIWLIIAIAAAALARKALLSGKPVGESVTWDCGYAAPTARMQYTASSFIRPLAADFRMILRMTRKLTRPSGFFPKEAYVSTSTPDLFQDRIYGRSFRGLSRFSARMKRLQHGKIQVYVLYIAVTLLVLLVWKLR